MRGVGFVVFVSCPAVPSSAVPVLHVLVPVSVVASYLPSFRSRALPSASFLGWLEGALASRGVSLPRGWVFVRRAVSVSPSVVARLPVVSLLGG